MEWHTHKLGFELMLLNLSAVYIYTLLLKPGSRKAVGGSYSYLDDRTETCLWPHVLPQLVTCLFPKMTCQHCRQERFPTGRPSA